MNLQKKEIGNTPNYDRNIYAMSRVVTEFVPCLKADEEEYNTLLRFLNSFWKGVPLIDDALDRLRLSESEDFERSFLQFMDEMEHVDDVEVFKRRSQDYADRFGINLCPSPKQVMQLESLYDSMLICNELDLFQEVKAFSSNMIQVSRDKRDAQSPQEIIQILENENKAISKLFDSFLRKMATVSPETREFERMSEFLFLGEQVRNVFDDMVDARSDKRRGEINLDLNFDYYTTLTSHWVKNLGLMTYRYGNKFPMILSIILKQYCGNIWMNRHKGPGSAQANRA